MRGRRKRRGKHEREYSSVCGSSDRYDNRCRVPYNNTHTHILVTPTTQPHYYNQELPYPSVFSPVSFRPTQRINITTYTVRRILAPLPFAHLAHPPRRLSHLSRPVPEAPTNMYGRSPHGRDSVSRSQYPYLDPPFLHVSYSPQFEYRPLYGIQTSTQKTNLTKMSLWRSVTQKA